MPGRHRGNLPASFIDRDYPFQVAIQDDLCVAQNLTIIMNFCEEHGLDCKTRKVTATWQGSHHQMTYRLHCFRDLASAELFRSHFSGEMFDPQKDREGGKTHGAWRRADTYHRLVELGPLSVPAILRT